MNRARAARAFALLFERIGLAALALAFVFALAIGACSSVPPGFSTIAPRVIDREGYGQCLESGGKLEHEGASVALLSSVCLLRRDGGSSSAPAASSSSSSPAQDSADVEPKDASSSSSEGEDR